MTISLLIYTFTIIPWEPKLGNSSISLVRTRIFQISSSLCVFVFSTYHMVLQRIATTCCKFSWLHKFYGFSVCNYVMFFLSILLFFKSIFNNLFLLYHTLLLNIYMSIYFNNFYVQTHYSYKTKYNAIARWIKFHKYLN